MIDRIFDFLKYLWDIGIISKAMIFIVNGTSSRKNFHTEGYGLDMINTDFFIKEQPVQ